MDNSDEFFQKSHYNVLRGLLCFSGLWPYHTIRRRCATYFGFLLLLGSGLTLEILGVIDAWPDSIKVIDCLPLLVLAIIALIKTIYGILILPEIKTLLVQIKDYCFSPKSDHETNILTAQTLFTRNLSLMYTAFLVSQVLLFAVAVVLTKVFYMRSIRNNSTNGEIDLQLGLNYRVGDIVDINKYYAPIVLHSTVCDMCYSLFIGTQDVIYLTFVQHCCSLFESLRYRLEHIIQFEGNDGALVPTSKDKIRMNILYSIRRHAEVIEFATKMEQIFRLPLLVHLGATISMLAVSGFQIITNTQDISRAVKYSVYLNVLFINTFLEHWLGQKIIDYSEQVYTSAYNARWYEMPNEARKLLIMIMLRSIKPSQITAGKIIVMSYVNFNAVLRLSSSYFMLLRSMH